jgi:Plasmid encoded RepA protein
MGEVHDLILKHGRQGARALLGDEQRRIVDLAANFMAIEDSEIGVTFSGFCMVSLPHRRLPDDEVWLRENGRVKLTLEPGVVPGTKHKVGVPFGAQARMVLLYLQSAAIRNNSPVVELGPSMHGWMTRMGVGDGGKNYRILREQMQRVALCNFTFRYEAEDGPPQFTKDSIVRSGLGSIATFGLTNPAQGRLWEDTVMLSDTFWQQLKKHPVPLLEAAIRAISNQSQALDIYIWLAYRLHVLDRPTTVSWDRLHQQFGAGYKEVRFFRRKFIESLKRALAVYPDADVDVATRGLVLKPSAPPVPDRFMIAGRAL